MKKLLLTTLTVFALSAQAGYLGSGHNWNTGSSDPFAAAIASAETDYATALAASAAWRDTGAMIKEAHKLQKSGDTAGALAVANAAANQATMALAQAAVAGSAGPRF